MRHGSAMDHEGLDRREPRDTARILPDAQTLGVRLLLVARSAARLHAEQLAAGRDGRPSDAPASLAELIGART